MGLDPATLAAIKLAMEAAAAVGTVKQAADQAKGEDKSSRASKKATEEGGKGESAEETRGGGGGVGLVQGSPTGPKPGQGNRGRRATILSGGAGLGGRASVTRRSSILGGGGASLGG